MCKRLHFQQNTEAATRGVLCKKVFLEILQNSQENTCGKVAGLKSATLLKKRLWHRCFPVNFVKFLRTFFLQNTSGQVLLEINMKRVWTVVIRVSKTSTKIPSATFRIAAESCE